jgi:hypothetical protein
LKVTLDAGETADLFDGDWRVNADKARMWAESASGQEWDNFREDVFPLVPEETEEGNPRYRAYARDTVVFTVTPKRIEAEKQPMHAREGASPEGTDTEGASQPPVRREGVTPPPAPRGEGATSPPPRREGTTNPPARKPGTTPAPRDSGLDLDE